jgi:hypothetical protein
MNDYRTAADSDRLTDPPERSSSQVWRLGVWVILVQVGTMILLWVMQAAFAG